ncbi:hypothetical protein SAMN04488123_1385 [Natribacillus halophilus]|uniref:Uncharacterized protein n=1 Tax=Natribacillus halophilus TaxID=549003 RepID=A0A1G8SWJ3_9BACI|nr:hypothetical protein SAMN04488123_1385 [Natribacillus halophilus]
MCSLLAYRARSLKIDLCFVEEVSIISDHISADEYKKLKNKSLINTFITIPISVVVPLYFFASLIEGELIPFNDFLGPIAAVYIVSSLIWIFTNTDKRIKREKRIEFKKKNKSKKRVVIENSIFTLLFILLFAYAIFLT